MRKEGYEVVVFPCHDHLEQEPLPVFLSIAEADAIVWEWRYYKGYQPPRYPVPAIPMRVGYVPSGIGAMAGVPYVYITTATRCLTYWRGIGLVEEEYAGDGTLNRRIRYVSMRGM
jgi:hypothetical protein